MMTREKDNLDMFTKYCANSIFIFILSSNIQRLFPKKEKTKEEEKKKLDLSTFFLDFKSKFKIFYPTNCAIFIKF